MIRAPFLFLVALACSALAGVDASAATLAPGDHEFAIAHQQLRRSYLVRVPPHAVAGAPLPVVINFHGGGGHADVQKQYSRMDAAADRDGYIAVYPDGSGGIGGRLLTWNAGACFSFYQHAGSSPAGGCHDRAMAGARRLSQAATGRSASRRQAGCGDRR